MCEGVITQDSRMARREKRQFMERDLVRRWLSRLLPANESTGQGGHESMLGRHRFDRVFLAGLEFGSDWNKAEVRRLEHARTQDATFPPVRQLDRHAVVLSRAPSGVADFASASAVIPRATPEPLASPPIAD